MTQILTLNNLKKGQKFGVAFLVTPPTYTYLKDITLHGVVYAVCKNSKGKEEYVEKSLEIVKA